MYKMILGLLTAVVLIGTACTSNEASTAAPKAEQISCTAAYRSAVTKPIEREESITFEDSDTQQNLAFANLTLNAEYWTGEFDGERAFRVWVTDTNNGETVTSHLYQFPQTEGPQNQFVGGHGFTGLNYIYHSSGAEMQFWCLVP